MVLREANVAPAFASPLVFEAQLCALLRVFLPQVFACHQRRVHVVKRIVREERTILVCLDKLRRLRGQPVRQMLPVRAVGQARISVGRKILLPAVRAALVDAPHVDIEALILRPPTLGAQMPLPGEKRRITRRLHRLRERRSFQREPVRIRRGEQLRITLPLVRLHRRADEIRDARTLRPLPAQNRRTRRRAHRARRVRIRELRAILREAVEIRRLIKSAPVSTQVALPEIVGQEKNHVWRPRVRHECGCGEEDEREDLFHEQPWL